jgi:exopolysaccharide biosynthesis polyprenyl glycosylphosphotransferase
LTFLSAPFFALGAGLNHLYVARANERPSDEYRNVVRATAVGVAGLIALAFIVQFKTMSRLWVVILVVAVAGCWVLERHVARKVFARLRREGRLRRRIIIVGTDAHAIALLNTYERNPDLGYEVVGFVGPDNAAARGSTRVLGGIDSLPELVHEAGASGVVMSLSSVSPHDVNKITRQLTAQRIHVVLSTLLEDIDTTRLRPQTFDRHTMIYVEPRIHAGWRAVAKRAFDIVMASAILVVSLPVVIFAVVGIKLTSRGPVLFRQVRVGKDGVPFEVLKFRTMVENAEELKSTLESANEMDGPLFKIERDPRVTPIGRFLRKFSIDEIPQLWCVLSGTMSLVGPRPALPSEVEAWDADVHERLRVPPGLTGMWQVSGRSESTFEHYKRMDLYYVHNWSLLHDVRICVKTVGVVLSGRGAS